MQPGMVKCWEGLIFRAVSVPQRSRIHRFSWPLTLISAALGLGMGRGHFHLTEDYLPQLVYKTRACKNHTYDQPNRTSGPMSYGDHGTCGGIKQA